MIDHYLEHTINQKKKYIYIQKGRWLLLLIAAGLECVNQLYIKQEAYPDYPLSYKLFGLAYAMVGYFCFVFYWVPVYLKSNQILKFISSVVLYSAAGTCIESYLHYEWLMEAGHMDIQVHQLVGHYILHYFTLFSTITGFLFLVEILDDISLRKETRENLSILEESQYKLAGTYMDLGYMHSHMNAIKGSMAHEADIDNMVHAQRLLDFSEILRYKLYGYDKSLVTLEEELQISSKIIEQYNRYFSYATNNEIIWEIQTEATDRTLHKCTLVNILMMIVDGTRENKFRDVVIFTLAEEEKLMMAVDLKTNSISEADQLQDKIHHNLLRFNQDFKIDLTQNDNEITINISLQLWKK